MKLTKSQLMAAAMRPGSSDAQGRGAEKDEKPAGKEAVAKAAPVPEILVNVAGERHHRPFRLGRTAWRWFWSAVDLVLLVAIVGIIVWALGELVMRHYIPANAFTTHIASVARWESHVVMGFFAHHPVKLHVPNQNKGGQNHV